MAIAILARAICVIEVEEPLFRVIGHCSEEVLLYINCQCVHLNSVVDPVVPSHHSLPLGTLPDFLNWIHCIPFRDRIHFLFSRQMQIFSNSTKAASTFFFYPLSLTVTPSVWQQKRSCSLGNRIHLASIVPQYLWQGPFPNTLKYVRCSLSQTGPLSMAQFTCSGWFFWQSGCPRQHECCRCKGEDNNALSGWNTGRGECRLQYICPDMNAISIPLCTVKKCGVNSTLLK